MSAASADVTKAPQTAVVSAILNKTGVHRHPPLIIAVMIRYRWHGVNKNERVSSLRDMSTLKASGHPVLPRQKRAVRQRASLLDVTERIVGDEGVQAATTTRIAHEAGVAVGTVYRYFEDRDAIILCAYDRTVDRIIDICSQTLSDLDSDIAADAAARTPVADLPGGGNPNFLACTVAAGHAYHSVHRGGLRFS